MLKNDIKHILRQKQTGFFCKHKKARLSFFTFSWCRSTPRLISRLSATPWRYRSEFRSLVHCWFRWPSRWGEGKGFRTPSCLQGSAYAFTEGNNSFKDSVKDHSRSLDQTLLPPIRDLHLMAFPFFLGLSQREKEDLVPFPSVLYDAPRVDIT